MTPRHPVTQAWLLAVVITTALIAICIMTSSGNAPSTAALETPAQAAGPSTSSSSVSPDHPVVRAAAPTASQAVEPLSDPRPRVVVHTMSMDAPIQGGLTAHQEQALSARLLRAHQDAAIATPSEYWTPAMGRSAVARAESWLGMPYSWAGGNASGPTLGRCDPGDGGDLDCHVVGFDCSGLTLYAWAPYESLPHLAASQRAAGAFHPTLAQLKPGDLVFFAGYLPGGTGHVAMYAGHGNVIEAPRSGAVIQRSTLASVLAEDGAYRGAVRPFTGRTPTLTSPTAAVPSNGGKVTLRGTGLASVDTVHLGGVAVQHFVRQSDTRIVLRVPAHGAGTVPVTVSTPWRARSRPVTLTYAAPAPASPVTSSPVASSTTRPTLTAPSSPAPSSTARSSGAASSTAASSTAASTTPPLSLSPPRSSAARTTPSPTASSTH